MPHKVDGAFVIFFYDLGTFFSMRVERDGWIKWVDDDLMVAVVVQLWVNEFSREL